MFCQQELHNSLEISYIQCSFLLLTGIRILWSFMSSTNDENDK